MNCPKCGKEMEEGRMTAGQNGIFWIPENKSMTRSFFDSKTVTISERSFSAKGVPAYICQACRKVIADY